MSKVNEFVEWKVMELLDEKFREIAPVIQIRMHFTRGECARHGP
jgi:hypothetical protein